MTDLKIVSAQTISPDVPMETANRKMISNGVRLLLVVDDEQRVLGLITASDILGEKPMQYVQKTGCTHDEILVRDIMTSKVVYLRSDQSAQECMALMTDKHIRHMPVFEDEKLVGIISIGDLVKAIISDQEFTIQQLVNYISGVSA